MDVSEDPSSEAEAVKKANGKEEVAAPKASEDSATPASPTGASKSTSTRKKPSSAKLKFLRAIDEGAKEKPELRFKMMGDVVCDLQEHLNREMNNALVVDGNFDKQTRYILQSYQHSRGLKPDGVAGYKTWVSLLAEAV